MKGNVSFPFETFYPQTIFLKEAGLYSLIFSLKLETAKLFRDWVFEEVLPSIRKTGGYQLTKLKKQPNDVIK